jgi:myo-inositol-1(or 4)-monophosphatase
MAVASIGRAPKEHQNMTPVDLLAIRAEAERLARAAGAVLRERLLQARTVEFKDQGSSNLVTDADHASEALLLAGLAAAFPSHGVLAEESGAVTHGELTWLVDPLDGTVNYAHGVPHFCVSLALEGPLEDAPGRGALVGVVYDPMRDELFAAARGQGAFLGGQRLKVSSAPSLARALVCTGFPYDSTVTVKPPLGLFDRVVPRAQGIRRMGAAALDLSYVAAGRFDAFFEFGLKPWDTAAGGLLVLEAGGVMSTLDGEAWSTRASDVIASNPLVAPALIAECVAYLRS